MKTTELLHPKRKNLLLTVGICLVFSIIISIVFAEILNARDLDHDCTAEVCHICLKIEVVKNFLKNLKAAILIFFYSVYLLVFIQNLYKYSLCDAHPISPIALKVRFNS